MNELKKDVGAELRRLAVQVRMANSKTPDSILNLIADELLQLRTANLQYETERIELLQQLLPVLKEKVSPRTAKVAWFLTWNQDAKWRVRLKALRIWPSAKVDAWFANEA